MQISEKPSGIFRETALSVVNEEYLQGVGKLFNKEKTKKELKDLFPVTPLSLSDSQADVLKKIEQNPLVAVYGPPGTGKSQTIVNLVAHLIANGKTVLVASRMDKAVDVVAQRLNELGAPFLALRAGRLNYQKSLSFKLNDLLSDKIDIDTGYEDAILVDTDDMRDLLCKIKELEDKCEKILSYERQWHDTIEKAELLEQDLGEHEFVKKKLKKEEVDNIKKLICAIEKNQEKRGLFSGLKNMWNSMKIKKLLGVSDFSTDFETVSRTKRELEVSDLQSDSRIAETHIHNIGNLHQLLGQIKQLKKRQRTLAVDILKTNAEKL